ncbi:MULTISPECIES: transposase [unclassified Thioalkalivibrio]|uniref:transposase n=1 Tax=unclassified Thioalkalivibrio TaxID=2621013 RepID=UPI000687A5D4
MARLVLPHMPHHVMRRAQPAGVFCRGEDCERFLEGLRELSCALEIRVYAYCPMTNHVHLLQGPGEEVAAIGWLTKVLAASTTRYCNQIEGLIRYVVGRTL